MLTGICICVEALAYIFNFLGDSGTRFSGLDFFHVGNQHQ
jgi:hypothetical protein